jgi:hypothetical protein
MRALGRVNTAVDAGYVRAFAIGARRFQYSLHSTRVSCRFNCCWLVAPGAFMLGVNLPYRVN